MIDTALLAVALAALAGLFAGRAWSSAVRRGGVGDRLGVRASQHFVQGLQHLALGESELAVRHLLKVRRENPDSVEVALVLGNLFRDNGQVERAIKVHQQLLHRVDLTRPERVQALACLGMDFLKAGFLDRAGRAFQDALDLDPKSLLALSGLARIQENERLWLEAYHSRARLARLRKTDDSLVLAYLQAEVGRAAANSGQAQAAEKAFRHAITLDRRAVPAYLGLADLYAATDPRKAILILEDLVRVLPERAYHAFDRLATLYASSNESPRFAALCERLIQQDSQDWRARLALARQLRSEGRPREAHGLLLRALEVNPHALAVHLETWRVLRDLGVPGGSLDDYVALAERTLFYVDPHICAVCRYRAGEVLWRCPHCHEWGTLLEERVAPTHAQR
jgi:lipopolysaccharide biosynthesis regulator YciM